MTYITKIEANIITKENEVLEYELISGTIAKENYKNLLNKVSDKIDKSLKTHKKTYFDIDKISINIKYEKQESKTLEVEFFEYLLKKTKKLYKKTATYKANPNKNWGYAICDTPIQKGKGLFFGLNWGNKSGNPQTQYPQKNKERNWAFANQARKFIKLFMDEDIENLNYSNLSFFRTPSMKEFVKTDWEIALPLFNEYVDFVKPKWAIMFGKPPDLMKNLLTHDLIKIYVDYDNKKNYGYVGFLNNNIPLGIVPHPQARMSDKARNKIWDKVINELKQKVHTNNFIEYGKQVDIE